jgi:hypothetical protein
MTTTANTNTGNLTKRAIRVTFTLANGTFATGSNTTTLDGLRCKAKIVNAGGASMPHLSLEVYGMKLSDMNILSTLGMKINIQGKNMVTVGASDGNDGFATVFKGTITSSWFDGAAMPDVTFRVEANAGAFDAVSTLQPTSFNGPTDVVTVISSIANAAGYNFLNYGVQPGTIMLNNPYYKGSPRVQWQQAAADANILVNLDNSNNLIIMPRNGSLPGPAALVSKDTGMVGYPNFTALGVALRTVFNPSISFRSKILVQSQLTPASGQWIVYSLDHNLDALVPGGQWFSDLMAYNPAQQGVAG